MTSAVDRPPKTLLDGVRKGAPAAISVFVGGIAFGAIAQATGWGPWAPIVASALVFSGSAQFAALAALSAGGGVVAAVAAGGLISARFLPMGFALAPSLKGNRWRRAVEAQTLVDAGFVMAHRGDGVFDRKLLFGSTLLSWFGWVGGTVVGVLVAPDQAMMAKLGLDVAFPGFLLCLLLDELPGSRCAQLAAALGGVIAAGLLLVVPPGIALLVAAVGALIGLVFREDES
jgi:4-azaleucine resistance transporter AzlC